MSIKNELKKTNFESLELTLLRQEITILKQEKRLEREKLLKDIAAKLAGKNMAFPIIRELIDLPEEELFGAFYGSACS